MTKQVIVKAVGIKNVQTGSDPGDDLEIYGHLGAWPVFNGQLVGGGDGFQPQFILMNRLDPSQAQSITQGATLFVGTSTVLTIGDNEELRVGGHLKEQDTDANDSLGDRFNPLTHNQLAAGGFQNPQIVTFFEDSQIVEAIFEITVL